LHYQQNTIKTPASIRRLLGTQTLAFFLLLTGCCVLQLPIRSLAFGLQPGTVPVTATAGCPNQDGMSSVQCVGVLPGPTSSSVQQGLTSEGWQRPSAQTGWMTGWVSPQSSQISPSALGHTTTMAALSSPAVNERLATVGPSQACPCSLRPFMSGLTTLTLGSRSMTGVTALQGSVTVNHLTKMKTTLTATGMTTTVTPLQACRVLPQPQSPACTIWRAGGVVTVIGSTMVWPSTAPVGRFCSSSWDMLSASMTSGPCCRNRKACAATTCMSAATVAQSSTMGQTASCLHMWSQKMNTCCWTPANAAAMQTGLWQCGSR